MAGESGGGYICAGAMVQLAMNNESHLVKLAIPIAALEKVGRSDKARRTTNGSSQFRQSSSDNQWE